MALSNYHVYGGFDVKKRRLIVQRVVKDLRGVKFDALAVRGVSGLLLAPIVAHLLKKHVIVVRKSKNVEESHTNVMVESPITTGTYVVFDDFMASGVTMKTIIDMVKKECPGLTLVGGYCWRPRYTFKTGAAKFNVPDLNKGVGGNE